MAHPANTHRSSASNEHAGSSHYRHLGIMTVLSFVAMYVLMYAMVDKLDNVYMNLNQAYMAALMAAPMVLIELGVMRSMYHDKRLNGLIGGAAAVVGILCFVLIRQQTAIGDRQFLRSMIPHHAGAILMCQQAAVQDAEIRTLCENILSSQEAEISQMKELLRRRQ